MMRIFIVFVSLKYSLIQKKLEKNPSIDIFSNMFLKQSIKLLYRKFTVHNAPRHFFKLMD